MLFCRIGKHTEKRCRSSRDAMPKSIFTPTHTENARAISDGKREGKAFVTGVLQLCRSALISLADMVLASSVAGPFKWRQFEPEMILLAVGWYLRFSLSYRDVEELLAERGLLVDHVTVWRWVQRYAPEIQRRLRPWLRPTNDSWRVDETYIRVKGKWVYLYRAVDSSGATIDFLLSAKRDAAAAERFLVKALGGENHPAPRVINTGVLVGVDDSRRRKVATLPDVIQKLLRKGRKGTEIIYVPGNHDEQVVRYLGTYGSITVQKNATHTTADGRRILVFHRARA
jgi:transposase-like protein